MIHYVEGCSYCGLQDKDYLVPTWEPSPGRLTYACGACMFGFAVDNHLGLDGDGFANTVALGGSTTSNRLLLIHPDSSAPFEYRLTPSSEFRGALTGTPMWLTPAEAEALYEVAMCGDPESDAFARAFEFVDQQACLTGYAAQDHPGRN